MITDLINACGWDAGTYIFFSQNVFSPLIYYSHLTPVFVSIIFGVYIYVANKKSLLNKTLFFITIILSVWLLLDLILWATDSVQIIEFAWAVINLVEPVIYAAFVYFAAIFVSGKDMSERTKFLLVLPLVPVILLAGTHFNILGFNLTNCDRELVEGPMAYYNYVIELIYTLWILLLGLISAYTAKDKLTRSHTLWMISFILVLLFGFASGNILGTFSDNWALGQFGLFVIPVCVGGLAYFVVQFRFAGNTKIAAAQMLLIGLWLAVGSLLFLQNIRYVHIIVGATLAFLALLGYMLLQSFKLEVRQRQEIEKLAANLEVINKQQIVLIHFVTHQVKGFVAKSRNIFSMMLEGDFGQLPDSMKAIAEEGFKSDTKGVSTIQEILNASNIKSGKVTYANIPVDLCEVTKEVMADLKPVAEGKGLALSFTCSDTVPTIAGDRLQLLNALKNLIDNSIKYTVKGEVNVILEKGDSVVRLIVKDTGIGITEEDMKNLFTEGGHGKDSQKINVDSTGFGLFIVKNIIEAHHGRVWAESPGEGKGSRFVVELPISATAS